MNKAKHYCDNINCNHYNTNGLCCLFNPDNCKYRQLQKKNAELKEKLKPENCLKSLAKSGLVKFTCENGNEHDQLTKAKEIIKTLADDLSMYSGNYQKELLEAEQFLNENEVEG